MLRRACTFRKSDGRRCRAAPLISEDYCFWHSPDHAEEAAEARRLGGYRRRREAAVIGAYDLEGLDGLSVLRRVLEIALLDTLGMDNSVARSRALSSLVSTGLKLYEVGSQEERLAALEAAVQGQRLLTESVFDTEPEQPDFSDDNEDTDD